jgi:uncharacterized damage-inducible protein DinB
MEKEILEEMLAQNRKSCSYAFESITEESSSRRVNRHAASIGFIYRHIGESMSLFGLFFGRQTDVENTTMGKQDEGQHFDLETSHRLVESGYAMLAALVDETPEEAWLDPIETPFFGTVTRVRLFAHVLYHTAHHAGQISLSLARGHLDGEL